MSVSNGQPADAPTFNGAFVSKTADSTVISIVDLNNAGSGGQIANTQQAINDNTSNISTNTTDIATNTSDIASLDSRVSALEAAVVTSLEVAGFATLDFSSSNVGTGAYVEVVADTGADVIKKISSFYPDGDPMFLAVGAASSEVDLYIITAGGQDQSGLEVNIPANSRLSVKLAAGTTNDTGIFVLNLFKES